MTTSTTSQAIKESLLAAGRSPLLQATPIDCTARPTLGSAGYDVTTVSRAGVQVQISSEGTARTAVFTIPTFDAASTYTVTVGAVSESSATPATAAAAFLALYTALDASLASTYTVTYDTTSLTVVGPAADVTWTATSGSPTLALALDYTAGRFRLYGRRRAAVYGSLVTGDSVDVATSWTLVHRPCGSAVDEVIGLDGYFDDAVSCGATDDLRPYLTDLAGESGDSCSPGAITYTTPVALVLPCILGGS